MERAKRLKDPAPFAIQSSNSVVCFILHTLNCFDLHRQELHTLNCFDLHRQELHTLNCFDWHREELSVRMKMLTSKTVIVFLCVKVLSHSALAQNAAASASATSGSSPSPSPAASSSYASAIATALSSGNTQAAATAIAAAQSSGQSSAYAAAFAQVCLNLACGCSASLFRLRFSPRKAVSAGQVGGCFLNGSRTSHRSCGQDQRSSSVCCSLRSCQFLRLIHRIFSTNTPPSPSRKRSSRCTGRHQWQC